MKKLVRIGLLVIAGQSTSFAQFTTTPGGGPGVLYNQGNVGIGTGAVAPAAKLSFQDVNSGDIANGITWYNPTPTAYGIHRTAGSWTSPNYQQLRVGWSTGIMLDPGDQYAKSYVEIVRGGLKVTAGGIRWANSTLGADQGGSIELGGNSGVAGTGTSFIDFHFNALDQDYNTRIINDANGRLSIFARVC